MDSVAVMDSAAVMDSPGDMAIGAAVAIGAAMVTGADMAIGDIMATGVTTVTGATTATGDTADITGIADTTDITATGGRGSTGLAGVIHGTPRIGAMTIPITVPTTIRTMAAIHMGATMAAITAALATALVMRPVREWPSCNADLRGPGIIQVPSMESWGLRPGEQFALTNATVDIDDASSTSQYRLPNSGLHCGHLSRNGAGRPVANGFVAQPEETAVIIAAAIRSRRRHLSYSRRRQLWPEATRGSNERSIRSLFSRRSSEGNIDLGDGNCA